MSKQEFFVGDTVKSTFTSGMLGIVLEVNPEYFTINKVKNTGYLIRWRNNTDGWISNQFISLYKSHKAIPTSLEAKHHKGQLETDILELIRKFNDKTGYQVSSAKIQVDKVVNGKYIYAANVKVEI